MNFDNEIGDISTRVDFSPLDCASVLITGGTGFVGNWVQMGLRAASLQGVKYGVNVLDRFGYRDWLLFGINHYDYIFHLAPIFDVQTLKNICDAYPKRVLFASSGAVYHKELNDYGRRKLMAENTLLLDACGLDVVIARMFAFCGPYLRPDNFAVGNFVRNAWRGEPLRVFGKGDAARSYMYGADLSVWLWKMMLHADAGSIYNVGSEEPITILQLADKVKEIVNPAVSIEVMNDNFIERAPHYVPDTSKTRQELGVDERYGLEQQIIRYAEWMYEEMK